MRRAPKLREARRESEADDARPVLEVAAVELPPPLVPFTRADGICLALAGAFHVADTE